MLYRHKNAVRVIFVPFFLQEVSERKSQLANVVQHYCLTSNFSVRCYAQVFLPVLYILLLKLATDTFASSTEYFEKFALNLGLNDIKFDSFDN